MTFAELGVFRTSLWPRFLRSPLRGFCVSGSVFELHEEGWVSISAVSVVAEALLDQGQSMDDLNAAPEAAVEAGYLDAASVDFWTR